MLLPAQGFSASATAIGRALVEAGYVAAPDISKPHGQEPKHFERAKPYQLWQTDLFTFVLKRENRPVHLVGFLDDHSRFLVGYGLHASIVVNALCMAIEQRQPSAGLVAVPSSAEHNGLLVAPGL